MNNKKILCIVTAAAILVSSPLFSNAAPAKNANIEVTTTSMNQNNDCIIYQPGFFYESITDEIKQRINGLSYKEDCTVPYEDLRYLNVLYVDFNGKSQTGELICNKAIAQDLVEIFYELYQAQYPIDKIKLIDEYNADDDLSCLEDNTSCFNYRVVSGSTSLSKHALGLAIDINPFYNPYVTYPNGKIRITPPGSEAYANREAAFPHKIHKNDLCYQLFTAHGFTWGGNWKSLKDYQHFQKSITK
ncbi:MAG: M15 family metallopeptidase [Lachnospiraceae bacterium]|nr:M15 family metallopeptidase [Lachnospiraceae bacterium]